MSGLSPGAVDDALPLGPRRLHHAGMSLIDGCPECVLNAEVPTVATPTEDGWRCGYRCSDCGHKWTTSWGN